MLADDRRRALFFVVHLLFVLSATLAAVYKLQYSWPMPWRLSNMHISKMTVLAISVLLTISLQPSTASEPDQVCSSLFE